MFIISIGGIFLGISLLLCLIFPQSAHAWGPGVHTLAALDVLNEVALTMPSVARVIKAFPLEYMYGSLAADFFIGKSRSRSKKHLHNWEGGFRFLEEASGDREEAYAYGFLSHLAADVIAHNFFVPGLIHTHVHRAPRGHLYWEVMADYLIGPPYLKIASDVLSMDHRGCDEILFLINGNGRNGLKAKKRLFAHSVKLSDYLCETQHLFFSERVSRQGFFHSYLASMVRTSCHVVKDFLNHPDTSPCLGYDPMGQRNIRLAKHERLLSRFFGRSRPTQSFTLDKGLLKL